VERGENYYTATGQVRAALGGIICQIQEGKKCAVLGALVVRSRVLLSAKTKTNTSPAG
jgi:hypothetical protein